MVIPAHTGAWIPTATAAEIVITIGKTAIIEKTVQAVPKIGL